jgi:hypothetical protein
MAVLSLVGVAIVYTLIIGLFFYTVRVESC